jgi:hypothetical protein
MQRPLWKALTLGAVVTGLGIAGAGTALVGSGVASTDVRPAAVAWTFDDLDDLDDLVHNQVRIPKGYLYLDDDWFDD